MRDLFKRLFIPHEANEHRPHSLRRAAVGGMMLLVLLSFAAANVQSVVWIASDWMVSTILPAVIVTETNEERETGNLPPLRRSAVLDYAATMKAEHMAENQYFAHFSPDGVSPWYWFDVAGYPFVHAGENLAIYFTDSSEVVNAWMDSPAHRANILGSEYREIGIGIAKGTFEGYETVYVVQLFGTPASVVASLGQDLPPATETSESIESSAAIEPLVAGATEDTPEHVTEPSHTVIHQDSTVALYSEHVSTTTGATPAALSEADVAYITDGPPSMLALATQPNTMLQIAYMTIASFVFIALILSILIDFRRQRPAQIAYGMALLAVMFILFKIHIAVSSGALIA